MLVITASGPMLTSSPRLSHAEDPAALDVTSSTSSRWLHSHDGTKLEYASFQHRMWPSAFLAASCLCAIFSQMMSIPILSLASPGFLLAYACQARRCWLWAAVVPLALCGALGGAGYFSDGFSLGMSYLITVAISTCMFGFTVAAADIQATLWVGYPRLGASPLAFPLVWTAL